jgi:hypothetical protein
MSDLEARLERIETIEAARGASWRYAIAIDTVDFDMLADVFSADAVLTTRRGSQVGRDAIVEYYRKALADNVLRKHFLTNQRVTWLSVGEAAGGQRVGCLRLCLRRLCLEMMMRVA